MTVQQTPSDAPPLASPAARRKLEEQKALFWKLIDNIAFYRYYKGPSRPRSGDYHHSDIELVTSKYENHNHGYVAKVRIPGIQNTYAIVFDAQVSPDASKVSTYVGCQGRNDLPDGEFNAATWIDILSSIIACEMRDLEDWKVCTNSRHDAPAPMGDEDYRRWGAIG